MSAVQSASPEIWPVLLPAIVGGGLALVGVAIVPINNHWLVARSTSWAKRLDRFEELLSLVQAHEEWLMAHRAKNAFGEEIEIPRDPLPKALTISALYFPQFIAGLRELDALGSGFLIWSLDAGKRRLSGKLSEMSTGMAEAYKPYREAHASLQTAITEYAVKRRGKV